jgi:hypothetical protein
MKDYASRRDVAYGKIKQDTTELTLSNRWFRVVLLHYVNVLLLLICRKAHVEQLIAS